MELHSFLRFPVQNIGLLYLWQQKNSAQVSVQLFYFSFVFRNIKPMEMWI